MVVFPKGLVDCAVAVDPHNRVVQLRVMPYLLDANQNGVVHQVVLAQEFDVTFDHLEQLQPVFILDNDLERRFEHLDQSEEVEVFQCLGVGLQECLDALLLLLLLLL